MGKFFDAFKGKVKNADERLRNTNPRDKRRDLDKRKFKDFNKRKLDSDPDGLDDLEGYDDYESDYNDYDDVNIQVAQKPESFHHFILENKYQDLEKSIRGYKDVWDKKTNQWKVKRKELHCFTDDESEDILRTAQSHLATDIKLGLIEKDTFGLYMNALYKEIAFLFETIAEYRYGRYGSEENQYKMKVQNQKIFLELWTRVQANYSRSIGGYENKATHGSVKGQESLQSGDDDFRERPRRYS